MRIILLGGTVWKKKKNNLLQITDLNLTTSPHFWTTTLFLRSKGQSSSFVDPHSNLFFVLLGWVVALFFTRLSNALSSSSKPDSCSFKIQTVSFFLVTPVMTAWIPPWLVFLDLWGGGFPHKAFQWEHRYFQCFGASGSSTEVRLFHGWLDSQSQTQSSPKEPECYAREFFPLIWYWVLFCLLLFLFVCFGEPCLLF